MVLKLTEEVQELRKGVEFLKSSISRFAAAVPTLSVQTSDSALYGPLTPGVKSYKDVASAGLQCKELPAAGQLQCQQSVTASSVDANNSSEKPTTGRNADVPIPIDSDVGFVTVVNKRRRHCL
jgi:hypothetical protein